MEAKLCIGHFPVQDIVHIRVSLDLHIDLRGGHLNPDQAIGWKLVLGIVHGDHVVRLVAVHQETQVQLGLDGGVLIGIELRIRVHLF